MSRIRSVLVVLALVALALPVIGGAAPAPADQEGVGDARAGLVGAHLEVADPGGLTAGALGGVLGDLGALDALDTRLDLGLLEGLTTATTRDAPDARARLSPLRLGEDRPHDVEAGPGERRDGAAVAPGPVSALLSEVGVSPFAVAAEADRDGAVATIEAVQASLQALGLTGLDVDLEHVVSEVTRTGARAAHELSVDGLAVGLGDLLPADLLDRLPLAAQLDLLEALADAGLVDGVGGLRETILATIDDIEAGIAALEALEVEVTDEIDAALLDEAVTLLVLQGELEDLDLAGTGDALQAVVDGLVDGSLIDQLPESVLDDFGLLDGSLELVDDASLDPEQALALSLDDLGDLDVSDELATLEEAATLLGEADDLDGLDLPAECPTDPSQLSDTLGGLLEDAQTLADCVQIALDGLDGLIDGLLDDLAGQLGIEELLALLEALLEDLGDLDGLLATVRGLLDEIGSIELLTADALELEIAAAADAAGGTTTLVCELGGVEILGAALGDLSCVDGTLDAGVDTAVAGALGVLGDVLASLPGVAGVEGLRLDLLPVATREVDTADDGTTTARARAVLLELVVPSVTIDPTGSPDLLDLGEPSEWPDLEGLGDDLLAALEDAGLLELVSESELDALVGVLDGLVDTADGLRQQILDLLGQLDPDVLDVAISTPAIGLVLDPESEASFTPAAADDPRDTGDPDEPAVESPGTELPRTGGGLVLLGLIALLGAVGLRRTG